MRMEVKLKVNRGETVLRKILGCIRLYSLSKNDNVSSFSYSDILAKILCSMAIR